MDPDYPDFRLHQIPDGNDGFTISITGYRGDGGDVVIPAEIGSIPVTEFSSSMFTGSTTLTGITLPETITSIGNNSFKQCTALKTVNLPDTLTYIGGEAFYGCTNLTIHGYSGTVAETYANDNGIKIVGDMPIYVSQDSSDVWANPKEFFHKHYLVR